MEPYREIGFDKWYYQVLTNEKKRDFLLSQAGNPHDVCIEYIAANHGIEDDHDVYQRMQSLRQHLKELIPCDKTNKTLMFSHSRAIAALFASGFDHTSKKLQGTKYFENCEVVPFSFEDVSHIHNQVTWPKDLQEPNTKFFERYAMKQ